MDLVEVLKDYSSNGSTSEDNGRNLADIDYFKEHPVLTWTYLVILIFSTVIGNVGNFLIIAAVLTYEKLQTKANVFVISLAVADSCVATVVQYFSIVGTVVGYSFFVDKSWLCHTVASICQISCAASLLNMIGVAMNRYICICRHAWYQRVYTKKNLTLIVLLIWVVAFLIDFPQFWGWGGHAYDHKTMLCSWDRLADFSYTVFFASIIFLPTPVILFCYISIYIHVQKSRREIIKMGGRIDKGRESSSNVQLAKTLFIVFMVYLACWAPYALVVAIDYLDTWPKALHVFTIQFAHTNSSMNSIIYGLSNPAFRKGYSYVISKLLGLCCPCFMKKKSQTTGSSSTSRRSSNRKVRSSTSIQKDGNSSAIKNDQISFTSLQHDSLKHWSLSKKTGHYDPSEKMATDSASVYTLFTDAIGENLHM